MKIKQLGLAIAITASLSLVAADNTGFGDAYQRGVLDTLKNLKSEIRKDVEGRIVDPKEFIVVIDISNSPIEEAFYEVVLAKRQGYESFILNKNYIYVDSFSRNADAVAAQKIFSKDYKLNTSIIALSDFKTQQQFTASHDVIIGDYFNSIRQKLERESQGQYQQAKTKYEDALKKLTCETRLPQEVVRVVTVSQQPDPKDKQQKVAPAPTQKAPAPTQVTIKPKNKDAITVYTSVKGIMTPQRKHNITSFDSISATDGKDYYKVFVAGQTYYLSKQEFSAQ